MRELHSDLEDGQSQDQSEDEKGETNADVRAERVAVVPLVKEGYY